jgi:two-component system NtrC family sensor kinase
MLEAATVRILVVRSPGEGPGEPRSAVPALERLGAEVAVEAVGSADAALARARTSEVDLVVAEPGSPPAALLGLLDALRADGPPVLVLTAPGEEERALDWFRAGAADCVAQASAEEALPVAALDLIRRQRSARQQQRSERRIAALRRYTRNIIQNINSALLVVDGAGRVTWANGVAEELLGEPPGGLVGRVASEWFEGEEAADGPLLRSLEKGERFRGVEVGLCRSDGGRVPAAIYCGPMRDDEGRELGAVAILQDLSETRRLQRQLFHSEKMASIGQLAAGVAHEINNPVGFIDANLFQMEEYVADLRRLWSRVRSLARAAERDGAALRDELAALRAEAEALDAEFLLEDLGKAIRESREGSERIRHIVQDLRAFARPDASERVWADVNQCLDSTANIVWSMMKHAVRLRKEYGELPALRCHPGQLKQVFMNLLMNAYQAVVARVGDTGELGCIEIATALEPAGGSADAAVVVTVRDDGIGIPASHLDRIFDPFFTTKEVGVGTGLGLSTAFHLVSAHGGRIEAESREGFGSTFRVVLPVTQPARGGA